MVVESAIAAVETAAVVAPVAVEAVSAGAAAAETVSAAAGATTAHTTIEALAKGGVDTVADLVDNKVVNAVTPAAGGPAAEGGTSAPGKGATAAESSPTASAGEKMSKSGGTEKAMDPRTPVELSESETHENNVDEYVNREMFNWDTANPLPDPANEAATKEWWDKRGEALSNTKVDAKVDADMKSWDKANPEPHKDTDPKAHEEWKNKRTEAREKTKEKRTKEKGKDEGESKENILKKAKKLAELQKEIAHLQEGIKQFKMKDIKSNEDKQNLAEWQIKLDQKKSQARTLQQEIVSSVGAKNPVTQMVLWAAVAAALVGAGIVMTSAQDIK